MSKNNIIKDQDIVQLNTHRPIRKRHRCGICGRKAYEEYMEPLKYSKTWVCKRIYASINKCWID